MAMSGRWSLAGLVGDGDGGNTNGPLELAVRDGVIETIRRPEDDPHSATAAGESLVLAPVFVNAHDHGRGEGNVLAGIADAPLEPWIESLRRSDGSTTQEALVGDACRAMLASGIGATVLCINPQGDDVAAEMRAAVMSVIDVGIRAAVVYPFADAMGDVYGRARDDVGWGEAEIAARLRAVEDLASSIEDRRIEIQLGPVGPQWVSEATLAAVGQHAARHGRRVHMHLLESRAQRAWADRTYPEGIVELLGRVGLLGSHVCLAHGTHLRPDELTALATHGCVLSFNPSSNLRLASGIPPLAGALASAASFGVGLDGLALGDDHDYWTELRLARGLSQAQGGRSIDAGIWFDRLSQGGRAALGSCAPMPVDVGQVADFMVVDLSGYQHLVNEHGWSYAEVALAAGRPGRVREVWVGGRRAFAHTAETIKSLAITGGSR
jgi:cytosine/adenosine deaminase-related metal-dependent hydrolase